jgi:hypothetical protein
MADSDWYKGYNVHAWSPLMKKLVLEQYTSLPAETNSARSKFKAVAGDIIAKLPQLASIVTKIESRFDIADSDIGGLYEAGLLVIVWNQVRAFNEAETYKHFSDTMLDIGNTCVQGDTHRLFETYIALNESNK